MKAAGSIIIKPLTRNGALYNQGARWFNSPIGTIREALTEEKLGVERLELSDSLGQMKQLKMLIENTYEFYENVLKMKRNQYRHILRSQLTSFGYIDAVLHDLDRYDLLKKDLKS